MTSTPHLSDVPAFPDQPWADQGICAQTDPEAFFPEKSKNATEAKRVCASCPVRPQCLDYALLNDVRWGVWGGMSERQRRRLKETAGRVVENAA